MAVNWRSLAMPIGRGHSCQEKKLSNANSKIHPCPNIHQQLFGHKHSKVTDCLRYRSEKREKFVYTLNLRYRILVAYFNQRTHAAHAFAWLKTIKNIWKWWKKYFFHHVHVGYLFRYNSVLKSETYFVQ